MLLRGFTALWPFKLGEEGSCLIIDEVLEIDVTVDRRAQLR